jgi:hypothetical protein
MIMVDPRETAVATFADSELEAAALDAFDVSELGMFEAGVVGVGVEPADFDVAVEALIAETTVAEPRPAPGPTPELRPERPRHLRIAPDSVRRRRHVRIAAAAAALSISATLFAVVGFNVELAQHQIELQKLETQVQTDQTRYYNLRALVATRSAPSLIMTEATKLGLVSVTPTGVNAAIKPPSEDPAGAGLGPSVAAMGSSLDNPVP